MSEDVAEVTEHAAPEAVASDVPEPVKQPEPEAPAWSADDEAEARAFGWKPPDEWQGEKPVGYIGTPTEWMDRVRKTKTFTTMAERMAASERHAAEIARKLEAVSTAAIQRQREQYETQLEGLRAQLRNAAQMADVEAVERVSKQMQEIGKQQAEAAAEPPAQQEPARPPDPYVVEYCKTHDWVRVPGLWDEAHAIVDDALKRGARLAGGEMQLGYVESVMRQRYPQLFPNSEPKAAPAQRSVVDPGGLASSRGRSAFDQLPADAKGAFHRFVTEGLMEDTAAGRAQYAKEYNDA